MMSAMTGRSVCCLFLCLLSSLVLVSLLSSSYAQQTVPTFPPASLPKGAPTDPTKPANHGFYQPSTTALNKLKKYNNIISIWFAGNSYDYLFGTFPNPDSRGIADYNAGVASGKYQKLKYPSNPSQSNLVDTVYPQLPWDFQGCSTKHTHPPCASNNSYLYSWTLSQNMTSLPLAPIEMSNILTLANTIWQWGDPDENNGADSGAWNTDPDHQFWNELYGVNGGNQDAFIWWGTSANDAQFLPYWTTGVGGTAFSYYNLGSSANSGLDGGTIPYIWQLAANYTLFDNHFMSVFGPSDICFLALAAGGLPPWGNSPTACQSSTDVNYGLNGYWQSVPCTFGPDGFITADSLSNCGVMSTSDCTITGEYDGFVTVAVFPQPAGSYDSTTCATVGFAPGLFNTTANPLAPGVYSNAGIAPPVTSRSMFDELDGVGVSWAVYGKGANSQINGNFCDPEYPNYSYHNNPLHYFQNFSDINSPYFRQHLLDDNQFFTDIANGNLPQYSFITMNEVFDGAISDSDIGMMDSALIQHMNAIFASRGWQAGTTLVTVAFSDHDGLWDHIASYAADRTGPGARVPLIMISPDHVNGGINHYPYEHFSLNKLIQSRWGITNTILTPTRYYAARDLTNSFDETNACYNGNVCDQADAANANQCKSGNSYTPVNGANICGSVSVGSSSTGPSGNSAHTNTQTNNVNFFILHIVLLVTIISMHR